MSHFPFRNPMLDGGNFSVERSRSPPRQGHRGVPDTDPALPPGGIPWNSGNSHNWEEDDRRWGGQQNPILPPPPTGSLWPNLSASRFAEDLPKQSPFGVRLSSEHPLENRRDSGFGGPQRQQLLPRDSRTEFREHEGGAKYHNMTFIASSSSRDVTKTDRVRRRQDPGGIASNSGNNDDSGGFGSAWRDAEAFDRTSGQQKEERKRRRDDHVSRNEANKVRFAEKDQVVIIKEDEKSKRRPQYYKRQMGRVTKLLDDNFGLIQVVGDSIALFDVCDVFLNPSTTASREGKKLGEVVRVGSNVIFHAALLEDEARIQYLASSVWLEGSPGFTADSEPVPILREEIHPDKVEIYKMVVDSVGPKKKTPPPPPPISRPDDPNRLSGVVRVVLVDQRVIGGVCEFQQQKFCFFLLENCVRIPEAEVTAGLKVSFYAARISWTSKVEYVATAVFRPEDGAVTNDPCMTKVESSLAKMEEIIKSLSDAEAKYLLDPKLPIATSGVLHLQKQHSSGREVDSWGRVRCLFSDTSGLLEDRDKKETLVYFESTDLNLHGEVSLTELTRQLSSVIEVRYRASMLSETGSIQYVAHDRGVILAKKPPPQSTLRVVEVLPEEMIPMSFRNKEKRQRYQIAKALFEAGEYRDLRMEAEMKLPRELVSRKGVVKYILNENFALVLGPSDERSQSYCLFDTYDLFTSEERTAADEGLSVSKVISLGAKVEYNACLIKRDSVVPYLATAVWRPEKVSLNLPPLDRTTIQSNKVDIYLQVVQSCQGILAHKQTKQPQKSFLEKTSTRELLLKDWTTSGTLLEEKSGIFAILSLDNGERALLSIHRAWLGEKQLYGDWGPLRSKSVRVNARKVSGFAPEFSYQVSFCHSGTVVRRNEPGEEGQRFLYSSDMMDWIGCVDTTASMDEDLTLYRSNVRR